jgi:hypothetical protein
MNPAIGRCPTCGITWTPQDEALWCKCSFCPQTEQRVPTEQQMAQYKINEPFAVHK